jgi:hypothetical protein
MAGARLGKAGGLLVASLTLVLVAATGGQSACNTTCERDIARCMATQCAGVVQGACRRRCKPAVIRTLAYAVTECREDPAGIAVWRQTLRIRRGDREPISVLEGSFTLPTTPDSLQACRSYGQIRWGAVSMLGGGLQRLGVSPDGSGVVFEVNDEFSTLTPPPPPLSPEQKGFFFVRSDGRGLRPLGPPSHEPSFGSVWALSPPIAFSPNGRRIAFTDRGPGPGGEDAPQVVVLDLATGQRTQLTHLPSGKAPEDAAGNHFLLTCCPTFVDDETLAFQTYVDPDGSNPEHDFVTFKVRIDGGRLERIPAPIALPGSKVVPSFGVTGLRTNLARLSLPGTPVNDLLPGYPITEIFLQDGKNLVQLTHLQSVDTFVGFLNASRTRAFFMTSVDPLGANPHGDCQIFSVDTLGGGLRQVTHFNQGGRPPDAPGCFAGIPSPVCSVGEGYYRVVFRDPLTEAVVFASNCDPLGANPLGAQIFAMRPDGRGLRQLTDAAGFTTNPDGSIRVELPGPFAYSAGH